MSHRTVSDKAHDALSVIAAIVLAASSLMLLVSAIIMSASLALYAIGLLAAALALFILAAMFGVLIEIRDAVTGLKQPRRQK